MAFMGMNKGQMRSESFTSGGITKPMLRFVVPFLLGLIVQNLYGAVDLFIVGQFASTVDVSAVTIGSQIMGSITQLVIGFATGVTVLIGLNFGAKNEKELARTTISSVVLFAVFALLIMILFLVFHRDAISAMQTPTEAISQAESYLFFCILGVVFIVGFNVISSILMGMGNSKTPFIFVSVACVINIVLDIVFVKEMGMGAKGAAIATTIAQAGSFIFGLIYLYKNGIGFKFTKKDMRPKLEIIKRITIIGGPLAIQNVLVALSFLFITAIINQMGLVASAAVGVAEKVMIIVFIPPIAFGAAVATFSSQNLGAGNVDRAKKSMWTGVWLSLVPSVLIVLLIQFWGETISSFFTRDLNVIYAATEYLHTYSTDLLVVSFVFCMNGYFNSCGKSWFTLVHSLIASLIIRAPLAYIFRNISEGSLSLIGWAAPISTVVSLILCILFYYYINRSRPQIVR